MKYFVRTPEGEMSFNNVAELQRAYMLGLIDPSDEIREDGKTMWRRANSLRILSEAKRTGDAALGGTSFLWLIVFLFLASTSLYLMLSKGATVEMRVGGLVLAFATSLFVWQITVRIRKKSRPHGS